MKENGKINTKIRQHEEEKFLNNKWIVTKLWIVCEIVKSPNIKGQKKNINGDEAKIADERKWMKEEINLGVGGLSFCLFKTNNKIKLLYYFIGDD